MNYGQSVKCKLLHVCGSTATCVESTLAGEDAAIAKGVTGVLATSQATQFSESIY